MPSLYLDDVENPEPESFWTDVDIEPWLGDLRLKLRPATRAVLDVVDHRAKSNPLNQRHTIVIDGKKKVVNPDYRTENAAWQDEFLKLVIDEWEGVEGDPPCDDEHKSKLRGLVILVNWIVEKCKAMAGVKQQADEKNS